MRKIILVFAAIFIAIWAGGCSDDSVTSPVEEPQFAFPDTITLKYGETVDIPDRDLTITFIDLVTDWRYDSHAPIDLYELRLLINYQNYEPLKLQIVDDGRHVYTHRAFYFNFESVELNSQAGNDFEVQLNEYEFTFSIDTIGPGLLPNLGADPVFTYGLPQYEVHQDSFLLKDLFIVNDTLNVVLDYNPSLNMDDEFTLYVDPTVIFTAPPAYDCTLCRHSFGLIDYDTSIIDTIKFNLLPFRDRIDDDFYVCVYDYNRDNLMCELYNFTAKNYKY